MTFILSYNSANADMIFFHGLKLLERLPLKK